MSPSIPQIPLLPQLQSTSNHRNRASSLSIARSPAVFASTPLPPHENPISRIRSNPPYHARTKSTLEDIHSDGSDTLTDEEEFHHKRSSSEAGRLLGGDDGEQEYELSGTEEGGLKGYGYNGPFQPPSSGELLGVVLSFGGVILLSIAAGLTTIYDWVL